MKRPLLRWLMILSVCFGLILPFPHCSSEKKELLFSLAPDFKLKTLNGHEITLSGLKGRVILLDFWATWCSPCRESIPHFVQLYKTYRKDGLEVIGMNMDRGNIDTVRNFVNSMDIPYPITITSQDIERDYKVTSLPTTILIDKNGKIRDKRVGFSSGVIKQITAKVIELISEKP